MNIVLNGEEINIADSLSILGLIDLYELPASKVAVERNLEIVPKSAYVTTMLKENDTVEIVHFIGGG
ncbi:MAG: sulfur carrier protein ThiS [Candidatus Micropelagos sp.]|jgi:thiamine biosynthesis protein ThiS|nr:thiamine biosynthesis protein ThiS [Hyphomicrobiales bacterium]MBL6767394.1 sulfur carrier protein ThiS [Candidatus Micropelagos sp.]NCG10791.1 sulfur carrier protein ThiS [Alphaproteobacteria bacterium]OUV47712.1 MAG: thiamine biosynthesis protein ThiS [Alphaproteobacteria bacterium TMED110]|tara:strand:- start:155 stop:355 length:201 start_codon:yes stop_codon:yes gene_type:complete